MRHVVWSNGRGVVGKRGFVHLMWKLKLIFEMRETLLENVIIAQQKQQRSYATRKNKK
jgi:hypothetical protein